MQEYIPHYSESLLNSNALNRFSIEIDRIVMYCFGQSSAQLLAKKLYFYCLEHSVSHPAGGTASHLIFFENACLEIIHIVDDIVGGRSNRMGINPNVRANWRSTSASPFGLGLRVQSHPERRRYPLSAKKCQFAQNNAHCTVPVYFARDNLTAEQEPFCFVLPDALTIPALFDPSSKYHQKLTTHPSGVCRLTQIEITVSQRSRLSPALQMLSNQGLLSIKQGTSPLIELTFDEGMGTRSFDGRPDFPVVVHD